MTEYTLTESEFELFRDLIYKWSGIALSEAKRSLVQGRLQKRLRTWNLNSYREYYDLLCAQGRSGSEVTEFINCITTNKTDFFRENHHFEFVTRKIIPPMVNLANQGEIPHRIRVWHAGCSTGEEPYSLAITLTEALQRHGHWDVRQLASDIDTNVLAHAQAGIYDEDRVDPVPPALLKKYFLKGRGAQGGKYRVRAELRDQITFKQINLLDDVWPINNRTRFDFIFCRNVVIYFDKPTQRKLFARYEKYLKPGGYLFIGHSESLLGISDSFDNLGHTIYRLNNQSEYIEAAA